MSNKEFEGQSDENIIKSMVFMKRGAVKAANDHDSMIEQTPPKSQIVNTGVFFAMQTEPLIDKALLQNPYGA